MRNKLQTSETFILSAILAFSGGLQDMYTYLIRNKVFSNAQTGNIVLMSQYLVKEDYSKVLHYLFPLIAFILGVLISEEIKYRYKNKKNIHWRQIVVMVEMLILFFVGFLSQEYNVLATVLVSFSCAMQVQAFRKVKGYSYASTMCIGNLRSGTDSLFNFFHTGDVKAIHSVVHYYGIIVCFALGAAIGSICCIKFAEKAIWVSSISLLICFVLMKDEYR